MSRRNSVRKQQGIEALDLEEERSQGNKCFREQDWQGAVAHYTNCIELAQCKKKNDKEAATKELLLAYSNRAEVLLQMGEFQLALIDSTKGLHLEPGNLKSLYRKGRALHGLKDYARACDVLEEALAVGPGHPDVVTALQQCKASYASARQGEYDISEFLLRCHSQRVNSNFTSYLQEKVSCVGDVEIKKTKDHPQRDNSNFTSYPQEKVPRVDDIIGDVEIKKTKDHAQRDNSNFTSYPQEKVPRVDVIINDVKIKKTEDHPQRDNSNFTSYPQEKVPCVDDIIGDVEIKKTKDGRGRGLYAMKSVGAGELLLVSNAIAVARCPLYLNITHGQEDAYDVKVVKADGLYKMYARLQEDLVSAVIDAADKSHILVDQLCALDDGSAEVRASTPDMNLFRATLLKRHPFQTGNPNPATVLQLDASRVRDIVARNSLSGEVTTMASTEVLRGLWLLPSFINHSCLPSAGRITVGNAMFLHAAKDINKGEEITLCYSDALLPLPLRQAKFEASGFKCSCRRCNLEKSLYPALKPLYAQFEALHDKALEETNAARSGGQEFPTELPKSAEFAEVFLKLEQTLAKHPKMKEEEKKWVRSSFVSAYLAGTQSEEFFPKTLEDPIPARVEIMQAIQSTVPGDVRTLAMAAHELKEIKLLAGASEQWAIQHSATLASNACIRVFGNHREDVIEPLVSSHSNCHVF